MAINSGRLLDQFLNSGMATGVIAGIGISGATSLGHRMFAGHGAGVWIIESGNDIINLGIAGAILAAWR